LVLPAMVTAKWPLEEAGGVMVPLPSNIATNSNAQCVGKR
jgi:hypothetical protein